MESSQTVLLTTHIVQGAGALLQAVHEVLSERGVVWFATNARGFNLEERRGC